jgi:hypothetical protein
MELIDDKEYAAMEEHPAERKRALLGKPDIAKGNQETGSDIKDDLKSLSHKFVGQVEKTIADLPKSLKWRSFYVHDLPILMDTSLEVRGVSDPYHLDKSQGHGGRPPFSPCFF